MRAPFFYAVFDFFYIGHSALGLFIFPDVVWPIFLYFLVKNFAKWGIILVTNVLFSIDLMRKELL